MCPRGCNVRLVTQYGERFCYQCGYHDWHYVERDPTGKLKRLLAKMQKRRHATIPETGYVSIMVAASMLDMSVQHLYVQLRNSEIPGAHKDGKIWLIPVGYCRAHS